MPTAVSTDQNIRDILHRVRRIEIRSRHAVQDALGGEYRSVFKGRGMEFDETREYQSGDEIRDIDWNVTARTGKAFIKRYVEEREQTVFFVVDVSASGVFGSQHEMKGEIAAKICAVLAFAAIQNKDRVGLLTFSDRVESLIPPEKGRKHVLRVLRELLYGKPQGQGTDLNLAIDTLNRTLKRKAIVFLVSDFLLEEPRKALARAKRRHDLTLIRLTDPREEELPPAGIVELEDAETGEVMLVDTASRAARLRFAASNQLRQSTHEKLARSLGIDEIVVRTDASGPEDMAYLDPIMKFFRLRAKRY
jgi:uncharacterized protein (DUF58 family)